MLHIIIDGYNLLHATRGSDHDWTTLPLEEARAAIINFLATRRRPADRESAPKRRAGKKQAAERGRRMRPEGREVITVVFDGAAQLGITRMTKVHGIEVVFSEPGVSADEVIGRMAAEHPNPRNLLIVTDDRAIRAAAAAVGAKITGSLAFLKRAEEESEKRRKAPPREPREKYVGTSPSEVERWREIFGFDKEEPESGEKKDEGH